MIRRVARVPSPPQRDHFVVAAVELAGRRPLWSSILRQIASSMRDNRLEIAGKELATYLAGHPDDPDALHLAARLESRLGHPENAVLLLERSLELAPDFAAARFDYASTLRSLHELTDALNETERLLKDDADNPLFLELKADIVVTIGDVDAARAIWEQLTTRCPTHPEIWRKLGDTLRALGCLEDAVTAYRRAIECRPSFGLAWSGLAGLQVFRFTEAEIGAMQRQIRRPDIAGEDRINILFALGKAYEDLADFARSYDFYAKANEAKRHQRPVVVQSTSVVAEQVAVFTPAFLHQRIGTGSPLPDPIFVVGRPRSGTTLVEQILSSHSGIEGTGELPYIAGLASRLGDRQISKYGTGYVHTLERLTSPELRSLGEEYLRKARVHRGLGRPYFIDKNPANYRHLGLIRLILPNAKIVDVRRNPAANCFSVFKLNYRGLNLGLSDLAREYRDYVELVAHFDHVLPGWIYRVTYENLVADPESEISRLLDYLGLPFEESCLRFYETGRAVRTPSSEQVRRPISGESVEHWRKFEPWLAPLLEGLGTVLTAYPAVPEELRRAQPSDSPTYEIKRTKAAPLPE